MYNNITVKTKFILGCLKTCFAAISQKCQILKITLIKNHSSNLSDRPVKEKNLDVKPLVGKANYYCDEISRYYFYFRECFQKGNGQ